MTTFRLPPEMTDMYYRLENPIVLFLFEHCGDSNYGENWLFTRHPINRTDPDKLDFNPVVDLYIKDPEVALLFRLKFQV